VALSPSIFSTIPNRFRCQVPILFPQRFTVSAETQRIPVFTLPFLQPVITAPEIFPGYPPLFSFCPRKVVPCLWASFSLVHFSSFFPSLAPPFGRAGVGTPLYRLLYDGSFSLENFLPPSVSIEGSSRC